VIGQELGLVPVQVRKDLQYTGIVGKPKTGYSVNELILKIENFLGWKNVNEVSLLQSHHQTNPGGCYERSIKRAAKTKRYRKCPIKALG
jgi:hypothetical protein